MGGPLLLLLVLLLLVLAALAGLGRRTDVVPRREWRLVQATRVLGVVAGGYAAFAVARPRESVLPEGWDRGYGAGQMLAPAAFGLVVLLFIAFGETVVRAPRPDGPRTASLRPRAARHYRPRPCSRSLPSPPARSPGDRAGSRPPTTVTTCCDAAR
ncbi:hypothetical protein [Nocardioides terrae]|nr:hypothetical protein [Nocardioides terrae]